MDDGTVVVVVVVVVLAHKFRQLEQFRLFQSLCAQSQLLLLSEFWGHGVFIPINPPFVYKKLLRLKLLHHKKDSEDQNTIVNRRQSFKFGILLLYGRAYGCLSKVQTFWN